MSEQPVAWLLDRIDPKLDSYEALSWLVAQLREQPESEASRAGEPLLAFTGVNPTPALPGWSGITIRVRGVESGDEYAAFALDYDPRDEGMAADARHLADATCLELNLALNGREPSIQDAEALSLLSGQPQIQCGHCQELFMTVSSGEAHRCAPPPGSDEQVIAALQALAEAFRDERDRRGRPLDP